MRPIPISALKYLLCLLAFLPLGKLSQAQHVEVFYDARVNEKNPEFSGRACGIRDTLTGKILAEPIYSNLYFVKGKRFLVAQQQHKWGLISASGEVAIPIQYKFLNSLTGLAFVAKDSIGTGLLDSTGKVIIPLEYDNVYDNDEEIILLKKEGKWGAAFYSGEIFIPVEFDGQEMMPQYVRMRKGDLYGMYARSGELLMEVAYKKISLKDKAVIRKLTEKGVPPVYDKIKGRDATNIVLIEWKGKQGLITRNGEIIFPASYDYLQRGANGLVWVRDGNGTGLANLRGEMIKPVVPRANFVFNSKYVLWYDGKIGILDLDGKELVARQFDDIRRVPDDRLLAKKDGWYRYIDYKTGLPTSDKLYTHIPKFSNGYAKVSKGRFVGLLNVQYKTIVPAEFESIGLFKGNWVRVKRDGLWGAYSRKGEELIPLSYEHLTLADGDFAFARSQKKWGVIDPTGTIRVPFEYQSIYPIGDYWFANEKKDRMLIFRRGGELVRETKWESINSYFRDYIAFETSQGWGIMNQKLETLIAPEYEQIRFLPPAYYHLRRGGKYGLSDTLGQILFEAVYDHKILLMDSSFVAAKDKKWGLFNLKGEEYTPLRYDGLYPRAGYAIAKQNGKQGILSLEGSVIVPLIYDEVGIFENGFVKVELAGKKSFVRNDGKPIAPLIYDEIEYRRTRDHLIDVFQNGLQGLMDLEGNSILACKYVNILPFNHERGRVIKTINGVKRWGVVDLKGNFIIPLKYDSIIFEKRKIICTKGEEQHIFNWSGKCLNCTD